MAHEDLELTNGCRAPKWSKWPLNPWLRQNFGYTVPLLDAETPVFVSSPFSVMTLELKF
jgi:hypothetical protein